MFNRLSSLLGFAFFAVLSFAVPVQAKVTTASKPAINVIIDISSQSMSVRVNGWYYASWKVSTARSGYHTPRGSYNVQRTARIYFSKKYEMRRCQTRCFSKVAMPFTAAIM